LVPEEVSAWYTAGPPWTVDTQRKVQTMRAQMLNPQAEESPPGGHRLVLFGMLWSIARPAFLGVILFVAAGIWRWPLH